MTTRAARTPLSLVALAVSLVAATAGMALAPRLGSLGWAGGDDDLVPAGGDGVARLVDPRSGRQTDVQLLELRTVPPPPGVSVPPGGSVAQVRLLVRGRSGDPSACSVRLWGAGAEIPTTPVHVTGDGCGAGTPAGPEAVVSTVHLLLPRPATGRTTVRVMWEPPRFASLPGV